MTREAHTAGNRKGEKSLEAQKNAGERECLGNECKATKIM